MFKGHAPFAPRCVLPDYQRALESGLEFLELDPPQNHEDALTFRQIMYAHVPSVTTYSVYLGDLDALLTACFDDEVPDDEVVPSCVDSGSAWIVWFRPRSVTSTLVPMTAGSRRQGCGSNAVFARSFPVSR